MKSFVLGLALLVSSSAFAMDPAAQFVSNTLNAGNHLLGTQKSANRTSQLCQLAKSSLDYNSVGERWLGRYANIATDQGGVDAFMDIMPSLLITKVLSLLGNGGATITVSPNEYNMGGGDYAVDATIVAGGHSYSGTALVHKTGNTFVLYDGKYFGFSGVDFFGNDFQSKFNAAARTNPRNPVSTVVADLMNDPSYIQCP